MDGVADVSAASMFLNELRARFIDFSLPIKTESHAFFISKELAVPYDIYLQPFHWTIWFIVLAIVIFGACTFNFVIKKSREKNDLEFSLDKCFVYVFGAYGGFAARRWSVTPKNI